MHSSTLNKYVCRRCALGLLLLFGGDPEPYLRRSSMEEMEFAKAVKAGPLRSNCDVRAIPAMLKRCLSSSGGGGGGGGGKHVCVVGGGPVGLLLSLLLKSYGVSHTVLERRELPTTHPQAHFMAARTMEVIRSHLPGVHKSIIERMLPHHYWRDFVYCTTVIDTSVARNSSNELYRSDNFKRHDAFFQQSFSNIAHLPQHTLEQILRGHVAGSSSDYAGTASRVLYGADVTGVQYCPGSGDKEMDVTYTDSTSGERRALRCDYLVGADGSSSLVRSFIGSKMQGRSSLQSLVNVHFVCEGLYEHLRKRFAMLYFVFNQSAVAVFVSHNPRTNEWVCQLPIFPPFQSLADYTPSRVRQLLESTLGIDQLPPTGGPRPDVRVLKVSLWSMHADVASSFTGSQSNAFLAGDAAHRLPPAGGFGMNTGVQDALNLAWRLALASSRGSGEGGGEGGDAGRWALLRRYDFERRQAATELTAKALSNYGKSIAAAKAAGADPTLAELLVSSTSALGGALSLPFGLQRGLVQGGLSLGLRMLRGSSAPERLRRLDESGGALELIYPREDLDCSYGAVTGGASGVFRSPSPYITAVRQGARLTHLWLRVLSCDGNSSDALRVVSTVQLPALMSRGAPPRVVLMAVWGSGAAKAALELIRSEAAYSVFAVVSIRAPATGAVRWDHRVLQRALQVPYFEAVEGGGGAAAGVALEEGPPTWPAGVALSCEDISGEWGRIFSGRGGAGEWVVAVRPDGHVLDVVASSLTDPRALLDALLAQLAWGERG